MMKGVGFAAIPRIPPGRSGVALSKGLLPSGFWNTPAVAEPLFQSELFARTQVLDAAICDSRSCLCRYRSSGVSLGSSCGSGIPRIDSGVGTPRICSGVISVQFFLSLRAFCHCAALGLGKWGGGIGKLGVTLFPNREGGAL